MDKRPEGLDRSIKSREIVFARRRRRYFSG